MTLLPGCDARPAARRLDLLNAAIESDTLVHVIGQRQAALFRSWGEAPPTVAKYLALDVNVIRLALIARSPAVQDSADKESEIVSGYFAAISTPIDGSHGEPETLVIRDEIAGMPSGINGITLIAGHPVVVHWVRRRNEWVAAAIQVYPASRIADELTEMFSGPRSGE